jgi:hypothetical protein
MPLQFPATEVGTDGTGSDATCRNVGNPGGSAGSADDCGSGPLWYELADDHSVLQLPSYATSGTSLALHVVIDAEADATIAWWETENGMWVAEVGAT